MQLITDDEGLAAGIVLDVEHPAVDLTRDRLGDRILDALVTGMIEAHANVRAPEGPPWPKLKPATIAAKGHAIIGVKTGKSHILDPQTYTTAPRDLQPREAWWQFPQDDPRLAGVAAGWQLGDVKRNRPARRIIGWTADARDKARQLVQDADFAARE